MKKTTAGKIRREFRYAGTVQGVGFRWTARRIAEAYEITGYVKNLPDGRVELCAEGTAEEIGRFSDELETRLGQFIRRVERQDAPWSGSFDSFDIRH